MTTLRGALRLDGDRLAVRFERRYAASPAEVWSAVTEPGRIGRWLAPTSLLGDGRYRIDFGGGQETTGTIEVCDPPHALVVTWDFPGEPPSRVSVGITPDGDGAVLVLDHARLPQEQGVGYGAGWEAYLDRLAAELTGGAPPGWDDRFTELLPAYRSAAAVLSP
jgi:uncharacterized protein YndB with AHSA1/START domain